MENYRVVVELIFKQYAPNALDAYREVEKILPYRVEGDFSVMKDITGMTVLRGSLEK